MRDQFLPCFEGATGPSSINRPITQGKKNGLTIFWPNDGLDTGPILLQKEVDIAPDDTLGSLYFNHLFPLGVDAMIEALELVKNGTAPRVPQDPNAGSYEGLCGKDDAKTDWTKTVDQVFNLIWGTNPQPGAWTTYKDSIGKIYDCCKSDQTSGVHIAATGGEIIIERMRSDAGKVSAQEFVEQTGLQINDHFSD